MELEPIFFLSSFIAGIFMFLAPCTLPLLPAYIGFISGVTEAQIQNSETRNRARVLVFINSAMFLIGFAVVFITFGTFLGLLGNFVPLLRTALVKLGGIVVILFGLILLGTIRSNFVYKERRIPVPQWVSVGTPASAMLLGGAFAVGWTPCIGPVYGTILIYTSSAGTIFTGMLLLIVFVLGYSVPFLLTAILISQASRIVHKAIPYLHVVSKLGGVFLVILGVSLLFGHSGLTNWFFYLFDYLNFEEYLLPFL